MLNRTVIYSIVVFALFLLAFALLGIGARVESPTLQAACFSVAGLFAVGLWTMMPWIVWRHARRLLASIEDQFKGQRPFLKAYVKTVMVGALAALLLAMTVMGVSAFRSDFEGDLKTGLGFVTLLLAYGASLLIGLPIAYFIARRQA